MKLDEAKKIMKAGDEWRSKNFCAIMANDGVLITCQGAKLRIDFSILQEFGVITRGDS